MTPDGETPVVEAQLDYQFQTDPAQNLIAVTRMAGPLTVQEQWGPEFARQFAEAVLSQLDQLAADRREYTANMNRVRRETGPEGPRLAVAGRDFPAGAVPPGMNRAARRAASRS